MIIYGALAVLPYAAEARPWYVIFDQSECTGGFQYETGLGGYCTLCDLLGVIQSVVKFLATIISAIAAVVIIYGGFIILTARGSPEQVNRGRQIIINAIIGFAITLGAWLIVNTIITLIAGGKILGKDWWSISC